MKEFDKDKDLFNTSVRRKFNEAKVEPSSNVWEGIEAELLKHDNVKMQRKAVFYRNVAAAVLLIAVVSIYFNLQGVKFQGQESKIETIDLSNSLVQWENNGSDILAEIKSPKALSESQTESDNGIGIAGQNEVTRGRATKLEKKDVLDVSGGSDENFISNNRKDAGSSSFAIAGNESGNQVGVYEINKATSPPINQDQNGLSRLTALSPSALEINELKLADVDIKDVSYFAVSSLDKDKNNSNIAFQSAFNLGSSSFNPNTNITSGPLQSSFSALNTPGTSGRSLTGSDVQYSKERELVESLSSAPINSNLSMTFGVHAGLSINERWKIKSGLQYGNYRTSSQSSAVVRDVNSDELYPYHGASSSTELSDGKIINVTSEYDLYNDFQILSVPLLVSYKFIDRKFGIGLVGGASADFLLKNTIRGGSDQISDISFDQNDRKSYKNSFYSALAGVEFSYSFSKNYAISLTPTYKKALTNITNDGASFNSTPDFISLDMSIQYMF
ncbi:hypothetical protein JKA74_00815 [Marivirga sp. S37H4]|uniref:Outer membrane protein beta-barrel domain-containing protein n=1 Tax=Marivirga aurantiaca TaxID=2802615 RepID=A0A935C502_9BACT|nr:hypothetical protein [Marivirga aurantiaca]MBK6263559.1 hypothetical protein [Marivirga aurantiaca]